MIHNKKIFLLIASLIALSGIFITSYEYTKPKISKNELQVTPSRQYKFEQLANDSSTIMNSGLTDAGNWATNLPVDQTGILGIAANFNIFANRISNSSSQPLNGNFATKNLLSDYGAIGRKDTTSYI